MARNIKPGFTKADVERYIQGKILLWENVLQSRLIRIGENFCTYAKNNGNYRDRTGNLRSSIYFRLYKNGEQVAGTPDSEGTSEGSEAARALIAEIKGEIIAKFPKGFVLVCVAGMQYSLIVESRGFDVITGAGMIASQELKDAIRDLQNKMQRSR